MQKVQRSVTAKPGEKCEGVQMMKVYKWARKTGLIFMAVVVGVFTVHIAQVVQAQDEPGTEEDDLIIVSKSYVDKNLDALGNKIEEFTSSINETITSLTDKKNTTDEDLAALKASNETLVSEVKKLTLKDDEYKLLIEEMTKKNDEYKKVIDDMAIRISEAEKYGKFIAVELKQNQVLNCGESTEIILRSGKATAIGGEGGGLSDITSGTGADINTGKDVPLNHLLMISRDDGRGIKATSKIAWVLVKGPYSIK